MTKEVITSDDVKAAKFLLKHSVNVKEIKLAQDVLKAYKKQKEEAKR